MEQLHPMIKYGNFIEVYNNNVNSILSDVLLGVYLDFKLFQLFFTGLRIRMWISRQ